MTDPFDTFGMSPAFELDLGEAERRHRELSRALHPDRHAGQPPGERRQALGRAIEVNEAWRVLRDPIRRAEALLARLGVGLEDRGEPKPDPELLLEMMQKREELATAARTRDAELLRGLVREIEAREARALRGLAERFRAALDGGDGGASAEVEVLRRGLGELRYYRRLLDEAAALEDELP